MEWRLATGVLGGLLIGAIGALCLQVGRRARRRQTGFNARAVEVVGRVVGWESRRVRSAGGTMITRFFPRVHYTTRQGQVVERLGLGRAQVGATGETVRLLYDPDDPQDVSFTGPRGQLGLPLLLVRLGVALLIVGLAAAALPVVLWLR